MSKPFSKSDSYKQEYCATVVQIGELEQIEGSDFLVKTLVNGFQIVIRKDEVKTGDYMIYCANETQLNADFLSANNLFELSERDRNANAAEVCQLVDQYKSMREQNGPSKEADELENKAKSMVGFFNKHGRVRMIKLRGCISMGFLFGIDALAKWKHELASLDLAECVDTDFDTIGSELFCKAYVPPVQPCGSRKLSKSEQRAKKISRFNRMIPGQFELHYDTSQLQRNVHRLSPDAHITISVKAHGTSAIFGNVLTKKPSYVHKHVYILRHKPINRKLHLLLKDYKHKSMSKAEYITKRNNLLELKPKTYTIGYDVVYSSRTVIKNSYINNNVSNGYYKVDVWGEYYNLLKDYIPEGMTLYGEIVGYLTGSDSMIQKTYDYGCDVGTNKLMLYRITTKNENGTFKELEVSDVYKWQEKLMNNHPELATRMMLINILYQGTLGDLYPNLDKENHWNENVVQVMSEDVAHFGMEQNEPMCKNKVPREGICLRIDGDDVPECYKLKCKSFLFKEAKDIDAGNADMEMTQAYVEKLNN